MHIFTGFKFFASYVDPLSNYFEYLMSFIMCIIVKKFIVIEVLEVCPYRFFSTF